MERISSEDGSDIFIGGEPSQWWPLDSAALRTGFGLVEVRPYSSLPVKTAIAPCRQGSTGEEAGSYFHLCHAAMGALGCSSWRDTSSSRAIWVTSLRPALTNLTALALNSGANTLRVRFMDPIFPHNVSLILESTEPGPVQDDKEKANDDYLGCDFCMTVQDIASGARIYIGVRRM